MAPASTYAALEKDDFSPATGIDFIELVQKKVLINRDLHK
jgi:hypothetical protein